LRKFVLGSSLIIVAFMATTPAAVAAASVPGPGQEEEGPPAGSARPLSLEAVEEVRMSREKLWTPADPETQIGVLVQIQLATHSSYNSEDFVLETTTPSGTGTSVCAGYKSVGWAHTDQETGEGFGLSTGGVAAKLPFLFAVPRDTVEVRLLLRGEPVGETLPVAPAT